MRRLPIVLVLCFGLYPVAAQEQSPSPRSSQTTVQSDNPLAEVLWRIAAATKVPIGFESAAQTTIPRSLEETPSLDGLTLDEALDAAVADGRYEWRNMGGIVVVRLARAWTDPADPLNRPVRNLAITGDSLSTVLVGLRDFVYTNRFVSPNRGTKVSLRVNSGTLLDVLNQLVRQSDQSMWLASYRSSAQAGDDGWGLRFELRDATHVTCVATGRRLVSPALR